MITRLATRVARRFLARVLPHAVDEVLRTFDAAGVYPPDVRETSPGTWEGVIGQTPSGRDVSLSLRLDGGEVSGMTVGGRPVADAQAAVGEYRRQSSGPADPGPGTSASHLPPGWDWDRTARYLLGGDAGGGVMEALRPQAEDAMYHLIYHVERTGFQAGRPDYDSSGPLLPEDAPQSVTAVCWAKSEGGYRTVARWRVTPDSAQVSLEDTAYDAASGSYVRAGDPEAETVTSFKLTGDPAADVTSMVDALVHLLDLPPTDA